MIGKLFRAASAALLLCVLGFLVHANAQSIRVPGAIGSIPVTVAQGGTNCIVASSTCVDNIGGGTTTGTVNYVRSTAPSLTSPVVTDKLTLSTGGSGTIDVTSGNLIIARNGGASNAGLILNDNTNTNAARFNAQSTPGLTITSGNGGTTWEQINGTGAAFTGYLQVGNPIASLLTVNTGEIGMARMTAGAAAPGAGGGKIAFICGTVPGTARLVAYAGTSSTATIIADSIGAGVTGC